MRLFASIMAVILGISGMTACQSAIPPAVPQSTADPAANGYTHRVGIIFEDGDVEGNPVHRLVMAGADSAAAMYPVDVRVLEIAHQADVETDIRGYADQDYDLLIGVGAQPLWEAMASTARVKPEQLFAVVGPEASQPNVLNLQFDMAQPSFMAGYLAAGISASGLVCTYGSLDVPNAVDYLTGFANGVRYYNVKHGADVVLLGWDQLLQVGALGESYQGAGVEPKLIADYFEGGCDVYFPVTPTVNLGLASMAQESELAVIGVDVDWYVVTPEFGEIWLTSVQKNLDRVIFDTIAALSQDVFTAGGSYTGTQANGGVGLAPFHAWEEKIPTDLKAELRDITEAFSAGELDPTDVGAYD